MGMKKHKKISFIAVDAKKSAKTTLTVSPALLSRDAQIDQAGAEIVQVRRAALASGEVTGVAADVVFARITGRLGLLSGGH